MKAFQDIYNEICTIEDEHRDDVYKRFLKLAKNNKNQLKEFLTNIPLDEEACLFEIYEALSEDDIEFNDLFLTEIKRLLNIAEKEPKNNNIYNTLESYSYVAGNGHASLNKEIIKILKSSMKSKHDEIRRFATWLIGDFVKDDFDEIIDLLKQKLMFDEDWRVRYLAFISLEELDTLSNYKLNFLDKIRVWFAGDKARDYVAL